MIGCLLASHYTGSWSVGTKAMASERIESAHYESYVGIMTYIGIDRHIKRIKSALYRDYDFHGLLMQYERPGLY